MKRSLLLLAAVIILLALVTAGSEMPGQLSGNKGPVYLFYCLVLLISIISVVNGILRVTGGNRSFLTFLYIFFSLVVFALAYRLVIN
jgi:hypothetical protein